MPKEIIILFNYITKTFWEAIFSYRPLTETFTGMHLVKVRSTHALPYQCPEQVPDFFLFLFPFSSFCSSCSEHPRVFFLSFKHLVDNYERCFWHPVLKQAITLVNEAKDVVAFTCV